MSLESVPPMVTKVERIRRFQEIPEIKTWLDGSDIRLSTRGYYAKRLYEFLDGKETPKQFLDEALANPREVGIHIKGTVAAVAQKSPSVAFHMRAALKSFLEYYDTDVHVTGKVKLRRTWKKPYLSWADAEKIISKTREPYESIFRFMLWSGLGQDEVIEINGSPKLQQSIEKQRADPTKDYIIIDLQPRKQTLTRYFVPVPKQYVPKFPLTTLDYKIRGKKPIHVQAMEDRFRQATRQVGLHEKGMGPHTLRSVFTSQCAMAGVRESVCEFMKGHGAGDKYGYSREVLNEAFMVKELRKLWEPATVSKEEVDRLKSLVDELRKGKGFTKEDVAQMVREYLDHEQTSAVPALTRHRSAAASGTISRRHSRRPRSSSGTRHGQDH